MLSFFLKWRITTLALLTVTALSLMPIDLAIPKGFSSFDKFVHWTMYFVLGSGIYLDLWFGKISGNSFRSNMIMATIFISMYGILLEIIQELSGYRYGDVWDAIFNCMGALTAMLIFLFLKIANKKNAE